MEKIFCALKYIHKFDSFFFSLSFMFMETSGNYSAVYVDTRGYMETVHWGLKCLTKIGWGSTSLQGCSDTYAPTSVFSYLYHGRCQGTESCEKEECSISSTSPHETSGRKMKKKWRNATGNTYLHHLNTTPDSHNHGLYHQRRNANYRCVEHLPM